MSGTRKKAPVVGTILPVVQRVEGLGTDPAQSTWLGLTLKERQERAFIRAEVPFGVPDAPGHRLVLASDVAVTAAAVRWMVEEGRKAGAPVAFRPGGELGRFLDEALLGREAFLAAFLPAGVPCDPAALHGLEVRTMDPAERPLSLPVPRSQFGADVLEIPLADRLLFPTGHWLQLLWANLLGLGPFLWREMAGRTLPGLVFRVAGAVLRARSVDPYRVAAALRRRGRHCRIHPSAVVEGSWLGDGVEIGAGAVVRGCVLADGARVEELAVAEFSVLGRGAMVQRQALLKFSMLEPRSACAGAVQLGLLGGEAAVKHGATLMDMSLGQGVRIQARGSLRRAPLGLAGVVVGPRAVVGSGVRVAPGRVIPPDVAIVVSPASVLTRVPATLEAGTWAVSDGTLVRA